MIDKTKIKSELAALITQGQHVLYAGVYHYNKGSGYDKKTQEYLKEIADKITDYKKEYHLWYAKAQRVISIFAPERLEEFEAFYRGSKNIKQLNYLSAGITHFLQGMVSTYGLDKQDYFGKYTSGVQEQIHILEAISANIEDILFNLESEIHYGIFKSEVDVAKELHKNKLLRPAGAVAGVVIESHLKSVAGKKGIKSKKKNPTMSDYNDDLKEHKIIDTTTWRLIQRCGDIRNHCVHPKEREPTTDEIDDIIRAAEKILSEVN